MDVDTNAERVLKREFGSKDLRMSEDCVTM